MTRRGISSCCHGGAGGDPGGGISSEASYSPSWSLEGIGRRLQAAGEVDSGVGRGRGDVMGRE